MFIYYHKYQKSKSSKLPLSFTSLLIENKRLELNFALSDRCSRNLHLAENYFRSLIRVPVQEQSSVNCSAALSARAAAAALRAGRAWPGPPPSTPLRRRPPARLSLSLSFPQVRARATRKSCCALSHASAPEPRQI